MPKQPSFANTSLAHIDLSNGDGQTYFVQTKLPQGESELADRSWLMIGTVKGIASAMASALISAIVVLGLAFGIEPFVSLEEAGADLTNRLYVELAASDADVQDPERDSFAFVDIDTASCIAFSPPTECSAGSPIPDDIVVPLVKATIAAGAKIVIVDIALPSEAKAFSQFINALERLEGADIILPLATRPTSGPGLVTASIPRVNSDSIHFAVFATVVDDARDGRIRTYAPSFRVEDVEGNARQVSTAPAMAANLLMDRQFPYLDEPPLTIFYSFPTMTGIGEAQAFDRGYRFKRLFRHYQASRLIADGAIRFPSGRPLAGRTTIISTSQAQGHDRHLTPVGVMSGAEVIVNATRAFAFFPNVNRNYAKMPFSTLAKVWTKKLDAMILPALLLLPFFVFREWLVRKAAASQRIWAATPLMLLAWFGVLAGTLTMEISSGISDALIGARSGIAVDLITPVLLIGLDVYREVISWIIRTTEEAIFRLLQWIAFYFDAVRQYF